MLSSRTRKAQILTVGQGLTDQRRLAACLPEGRWRVDHASSIRSAMRMLSSTAYDAVISEMQVADGPWTELRDAWQLGSTCPPIIIACDCMDARWWAEALSQGAYDVLIKPFNTEELLHVVQSACLRRLHTIRNEQPQPVFP